MTVTMTQAEQPEVRGPRFDRWRPGAPLLAMATGWVAAFAWSGMVVLPLGYLVPTLLLGTIMVLAGSVLRVFRLPAYAVAIAQTVIGLLELNLTYASHTSLFGVVPTPASLRELFYVIGNGAETLNIYASPVSVNPTHTHAFLVTCGLGLLLSIDIIAFGLRRPPLVALPLLVTVSVPVSVLNEGLALPVFVAVALLFMRLLASEHIDRLWAWGGNRSTAPKPRLEVLWQVALVAVVVALLVAPLVPVGDLLDRNRNGLGDGTSAGGGLRLTTVNPFIKMRRDLIAQTHTPLLYADTQARDTGYIRTTVLDQFRDDEWRPSPRTLPSQNKADGAMPSAPGLAQRVTGSTDNWKLQLAPTFQTDWLPLPYPTQTIKVAGPWRYDSDTLDVAYVGGSSPPPELAYEATSFTPDVTARLLEFAPPTPARIRLSMTAVPNNLPDVVEQRAKEVTRGAASNFAKAVALQDWFRHDGGFRYSLAQRTGSGMNLLADFITNDRVGYCEQFAAAMAAMARTLGIPSRVVVGFLHGTSQPDGRILYTSDDRHAWPELYFSGVGWVRFEPTPSQRAGATPAWTRQDLDTADPSTAPSDLTAPRDKPQKSAVNAEQKSTRNDGSSLPLWPVVMFGVLLLGIVPGAVRRAQRRRRLAAKDPVHLAEGAWAELHATALDLGLEWPEQQSPREQARSVVRQVHVPEVGAVSSLNTLLVEVERGRYGRALDTETLDPAVRSRTVATVETWRKVMLDNVQRERGWRGRLLPVSLIRGSVWSRRRR